MLLKRIKELRIDNDLKQSEMAGILNCSQQVYSNYELGQREIPLDLLIELANYYDVSVDYILNRTDEPEINRKH